MGTNKSKLKPHISYSYFPWIQKQRHINAHKNDSV